MKGHRLRWGPILVLLILAVVWGGNYAAIKIGAKGIAPLFMAFIRSAVASLCLFLWMRIKRIPLFPERKIFWHGLVVGLLFGAEFGCIYLGLNYTLASRSYIFVYTHPFLVALGAHFFLRGDRLTFWKVAGLLLAFLGVVILFPNGLGKSPLNTLPGDLLVLAAAVFWAATTLYVKRFLTEKTVPLQTLFYQLVFSVPLLLPLSMVLEDRIWYGFTLAVGVSLAYQCIINAFLSLLVWFELIHRYPVSLLAAFTFFTPLFGVFFSGALLLGEMMKPTLIVSLILVSSGMILVNRPPRHERPQ
ncbi:MAG: EamA family transporter [Proteobacteria bacterium]|nr:EamA family transporter [Pseudomonadota bacterium]